MLRITPPPRTGRSSGSALVLTLAAFMVVVFMGALVIDGGLVYGKRAEIAKAVDAAAIAGIANLSQGEPTATQLARDMFLANYRMTNRDAQPPDLTVTFGTDVNGNETISLRGTAYLRPLFLTIFPPLKIFPVHAGSQATRAQLRLSLSLDRSRSMQVNTGCSSLPAAVDTFVEFFDNDRDMFSLNTFSSVVQVDVRLRSQFQGPVHAAVPRQCDEYDGYTFFSDGLRAAFEQNQSLPMDTERTVLKVIVIFTDGKANTLQQRGFCPPLSLWNVTAGDEGNEFSNDIHLLDPVTGLETHASSNGSAINGCEQFTSFHSEILRSGVCHLTGGTAGEEVRAEARGRALEIASDARAAGNVIYTIGLGNLADQDFLREIANDPASPHFDPTQVSGEFTYAPSAVDLQSVFEIVARKILVRLSI